MLGAAMFLARLIEYDIPCWEERKIEEYGDAETQTAIRDSKKETEMILKRRKNRLPKR